MKKYNEIVLELKTKERELLKVNKQRIKLENDIAELIKSVNKFKLPQNITELTSNEKLEIYHSLFKGRTDVVPKRFESKKTGKSGYQPMCKHEWLTGLCNKPKVKCSECKNRKFVPLSNDLIRKHLIGKDEGGKDFTLGIYPLLLDDTCWFLVVDFDRSSWKPDVKAFMTSCEKLDIPAHIEISRSGNGAHIWIFFSEPISAKTARQMGSFIITSTMDYFPDIGFDSYDRFFPNQDTLPNGGFGNLIALPFQANPRKMGYTVFVDESFQAYEDQWLFLKNITKISYKEVNFIANKAVKLGKITGVRINNDDNITPWEQHASRRINADIISANIPQKLDIVLENQLYFSKKQLTPQFKNKLIRLAAFQNPEFYRAQSMRFPIYNIPRIISCSEDFSEHIGIPRGCIYEVIELIEQLKIPFKIIDKRNKGNHIKSKFLGILRVEQIKAVKALMKDDVGVLSASTAFGKTVLALNMITKRKVNTLILVHRVQLIDHWRAKIGTFLDFDPQNIGVIGGGKRKPTGLIDIATIQSLCKKGVVDDIVGNYGFVIVDECHHLSAVSFELVVRQCKAKYFLGLSATLQRKDGHHPIIFMQCGSVKYRVNDKIEAQKRKFTHHVVVKETNIELPDYLINENHKLQIQDLYSYIGNSDDRNLLIIKNIMESLKSGRSPVVITERKDHLEYLYNTLKGRVENIYVLKGGLRKKEREQILDEIENLAESDESLILATGKYLGEGFDDARLDTLFLTMPVSWKGTLSQYAGRLHREYYLKNEVIIYDYVDNKIPVLNRMFKKRIKGYESIGYEIEYSNMHQLSLNKSFN
jgi:superfamily II DNA or RNA helicase